MEKIPQPAKDFNFILYNCEGHTLHWGKVHLMRSSKRADIDQKAVEDQDDGVEDNLKHLGWETKDLEMEMDALADFWKRNWQVDFWDILKIWHRFASILTVTSI